MDSFIRKFYFTDESDLKMRVDYSDDLDGSGKLQSGKFVHLLSSLAIFKEERIN